MVVNDQPENQSRRQFLQRGLRGTVLILGGSAFASACTRRDEAAPQVVALFSSSFVITAGTPQRLSFGVVDGDQDLTDDQPLSVRILSDGQELETQSVRARVVDHDHPPGTGDHEHASINRYYALTTTLPEPGIYDLEIDIDGQIMLLPVQAFAKAEVAVPGPGDEFPALSTPTLDDHRGVDPLCTLFDGPCSFHTQTAADVLAQGRPMALLVATPAFCATSYCGPVLNTLIDVAESFPDITPVHVEPWANPTEGSGLTDPNLRTSATVDELQLTFEPTLFLVDGNGIVVERIDNVFDRTELEEALARLAP